MFRWLSLLCYMCLGISITFPKWYYSTSFPLLPSCALWTCKIWFFLKKASKITHQSNVFHRRDLDCRTWLEKHTQCHQPWLLAGYILFCCWFGYKLSVGCWFGIGYKLSVCCCFWYHLRKRTAFGAGVALMSAFSATCSAESVLK